MKKYLMTLSVLVAVLLMTTGCGEKKLVCTAEKEGIKGEATTTFKSGKATVTTVKLILEANSEEEAKQAKEEYEAFAQLNMASYVESDVKLDGKKITVTTTLKLSEMTDEQIKDELDGNDITEDGMKKYYEAESFTCK